MTIEYCPICNEMKLFSYHKCKPSFYVWREDEDFEEIMDYNSHIVFAYDDEAAAIEYAEGDWEFPDGEKVYVISKPETDEMTDRCLSENDELTEDVLKQVMDKATLFELESETVRQFHAHVVKE
jgi:hypothetical protein